MKSDFLFTSESVTAGHPDKLCDQISDAIVDHYLMHDPGARVISECAVARGVAFIATRFASELRADIPTLAREIIAQAGYGEGPFSARDCSILTNLVELPASERLSWQEDELDEAVLDTLLARNQVTAFGFACDQTPALMPLPIWLAHRLARRLSEARQQLPYLTPDGTVQVGVEYRQRRPARIHSLTLVVSQQAAGSPDSRQLHADLVAQVIEPVFRSEALVPDERTRLFVNPGGTQVGGGPAVHSGMTGRKTAIDTYGGYARHSESALSGKDPLRVDRTAAYAARFAAKHIIAAGLAEECEVQLSYSIGLARPVSIQVETFGTGRLDESELARRLAANFDFRVGGIIKAFHLRYLPAGGLYYRELAAYGQVGRLDLELPWENTAGAGALR
jgi:S-adenosylmethionine synthetase